MRRALTLLLAACLLLAAAPAGLAQSRPIQVAINGRIQTFADAPFIEGGRTMVPLRAIFEALDAQVSWDNATKTVTGTRGDRTVILTIGQTEALVNGQAVRLDVPGLIRSSRTYVPLRFVSEALGAHVDWDGATKTVVIVDLFYLEGRADAGALALLRKAVAYRGPAEGDLTAAMTLGPSEAGITGDGLSMHITGQVRGAEVYYQVEQTLQSSLFGTIKGTSHLAARGGKVFQKNATDTAWREVSIPARLDQVVAGGIDPSRPFASPLVGGIAGVRLGAATTRGADTFQELHITLSPERLRDYFATLAQAFGTNLDGVTFDRLESMLLVRPADGFAREGVLSIAWTVANPDGTRIAYGLTFRSRWSDPAGPIQWPPDLPR